LQGWALIADFESVFAVKTGQFDVMA
jgi:hypothetical protein